MLISAIILAGGRATRMGGVDKGLILLNQKPMIAHVISRLAAQVDEIFLNVNREFKQYESMGYPLLMDSSPDFIGPLADLVWDLRMQAMIMCSLYLAMHHYYHLIWACDY